MTKKDMYYLHGYTTAAQCARILSSALSRDSLLDDQLARCSAELSRYSLEQAWASSLMWYYKGLIDGLLEAGKTKGVS